MYTKKSSVVVAPRLPYSEVELLELRHEEASDCLVEHVEADRDEERPRNERLPGSIPVRKLKGGPEPQRGERHDGEQGREEARPVLTNPPREGDGGP